MIWPLRNGLTKPHASTWGRLDNVEKRAAKFDEQLNSLGLLGWELVTIEADGHGHKWGFFKKPR